MASGGQSLGVGGLIKGEGWVCTKTGKCYWASGEMGRRLGDSQKAGFGDKKLMLLVDRGNVGEVGLEKVNELSSAILL